MDHDGTRRGLSAFSPSTVQITLPNDDQYDGGPHFGPERREVGTHTAGETLQPEIQAPDVCRGDVLTGDVLQLQQIRVVQVEVAQVARHPSHICDIPGREQGLWVPFPAEVEHLAGQPHRVVRGGKMIKKKSLTSGRDLDLLGSHWRWISEWLPFRHLILAVLASGL